MLECQELTINLPAHFHQKAFRRTDFQRGPAEPHMGLNQHQRVSKMLLGDSGDVGIALGSVSCLRCAGADVFSELIVILAAGQRGFLGSDVCAKPAVPGRHLGVEEALLHLLGWRAVEPTISSYQCQ